MKPGSAAIGKQREVPHEIPDHLKRQVMGREVVVAVTNGRLDFGPWEQIFYGAFDGPIIS
jgi:thiamine phosphate synthase YjbQ (UPF0047 family)